MSQIARPCEPDPYAAQQLIEMKHCERCDYQLTCPIYGRPFDKECRDKKEWEER